MAKVFNKLTTNNYDLAIKSLIIVTKLILAVIDNNVLFVININRNSRNK